MNQIAQGIINKFFENLVPIKNIPTSQWAEQNRRIPKGQSAEPGRWRNDRAPHLVEIMDAADDPTKHHIVIMKAARMGVTEGLINIIGKRIDLDPCQIQYTLPTVKMGEKFSKKQLKNSILETPCLRNKIDLSKRNDDNTVLEKVFPGGDLSINGANSPTGMRMVSKKLGIADDEDAFPVSAGVEGDVGSLMKSRGDTFWDYLLIEASSPTIQGLSQIERSFLLSDQKYFFVPCIKCGKTQVITWDQIKWLKNKPSSAVFECMYCSYSMLEKHKYTICNEGKYKATASYDNKIDGFHISQLYSLFNTWSYIVEDFLKSHKDPQKLKVFKNTKLGETYIDAGAKVGYKSLYNRREKIQEPLPMAIGVITAAVDTQDDRLEVLIKGWGKEEESWSIERFTIFGDPNTKVPWMKLDEILKKTYYHSAGVRLKISATVVDTQGHKVDGTYAYVKEREHQGVYGIKGSKNRGAPIVSVPTRTNKGKINLFHVGVFATKEVIFSRLKLIEPGPGYIHFSDTLDEEFFKQVTAEIKIYKEFNGRAVVDWKSLRHRNEGWDLENYNLCALRIICPDETNLDNLCDYVAAKKEEIENKIPARNKNKKRGRRVISKGVGK